MLGDISGLEKIYIVCGYTDMRKSLDGLCAVIEDQLKMDPSSSALFLFCGRSVFCQVLFPEKSVGIPFFQQGIFPAFSGHYASLRMRACSIR